MSKRWQLVLSPVSVLDTVASGNIDITYVTKNSGFTFKKPMFLTIGDLYTCCPQRFGEHCI